MVQIGMTDNNDIEIYGLVDPETREIRYIGKANNAKRRYRQHCRLKDQCNGHKDGWIKSLHAKGLEPEMVVLEAVNDKNWESREKYWIKFGIDNDWPLTNISSGGLCHPNPIRKRYDWESLISCYLPEDELKMFRLLPENSQIEICKKTALRMMDYSWIGIKERGGNPKIEYSGKTQYREGSDMARRLVGSYGI